eukprot:TCONS_00013334-protein
MTKCPHCKKTFEYGGINQTNLNRHIESCSRKRKSAKSSSIETYFNKPKKTKDDEADSDNNKDDDTRQADLSDGVSEDDFVELIEPQEETNHITSKSTATNIPLTKCKGYVPPVVGEIFSNFPFQLFS